MNCLGRGTSIVLQKSRKRLDIWRKGCSLPSPRKYSQSLTKAWVWHLHCLSFRAMWARQKPGLYWSLGFEAMAWQFWVLALLLGLVGTSAGLWTQMLDFLHNKTELSHLVIDDTLNWCTWGTSFVFCYNKSCQYSSNPSTYVSLESISYDTMEKSDFIHQQFLHIVLFFEKSNYLSKLVFSISKPNKV